MHRIKFSKRSFVAPAVLALIAAGLLAFAGWQFIFNGNADESGDHQGASTVSSDQAQIFELKEFGINLTLNESLKDLTYEAKTVTGVNGQSYKVLYLTTSGFKEEVKACNKGKKLSASSVSFETLKKGEGKYPPTPSVDDGSPLKQFDKFFIGYTLPNGLPCTVDLSQNDQLRDKEADLQNDFAAAFKSAEEIQ